MYVQGTSHKLVDINMIISVLRFSSYPKRLTPKMKRLVSLDKRK